MCCLLAIKVPEKRLPVRWFVDPSKGCIAIFMNRLVAPLFFWWYLHPASDIFECMYHGSEFDDSTSRSPPSLHHFWHLSFPIHLLALVMPKPSLIVSALLLMYRRDSDATFLIAMLIYRASSQRPRGSTNLSISCLVHRRIESNQLGSFVPGMCVLR